MSMHGEWRLRDGADKDGPGLQVCALLRNVPPPSRGGRVSSRKDAPGAAPPDTSSEMLDVVAFPAVVGESLAFRRRRLLAYRETWESVKAHAEEVLGRSHAEMFEGILGYVCEEHAKAARVLEADRSGHTWSCALAVEELPVGFIFAGGVNSSDHRQTFEDLEAFLREQGNHVARVQPSEGQKDSGPGPALASALRQFSGLQGPCGDDVEALAAWYQDVVGAAEGRRGASDGEAAVTDEAGGEGGGEAPAAAPAVLILQELEAWDPSSLCDLLLLLSDNRARLPLVVLAHVSTSATALQKVLQADAAARLRAHVFRLPSALARLELILGDVLLSGRHALLLHHSVFMAIDELFNHHDFTTASLMRGLQVALLTHFVSEPLAHLMPSAAKGEDEIRRVVEEIVSRSPQLLACGRMQLCPEVDRTAPDVEVADGIVAALVRARSAQVGQALALRWLSSTARALAEEDASAFRSGFGVKDLFRVGCFPSYFAPGGKGMTSLAQMTSALSVMKEEQARPLLDQFLRDVALVEGGADAARELVEEAESILSGADTGANCDGDDQQEQQPAERAEKEGEERSGKGEEGNAEEAGGGSSCANINSISSASNKSPGTSSGGGSRRHSYGCSRRGVLSAALAEVSSKASASPSASQDRTGEREAGRRTAALLRSAVERFLSKHPSSQRGSAVLLCRGDLPDGEGGAVKLTGAPRLAVHRAMYPEDYLPSVLDDGISSAVMKHDTATVYQLAQNQGEHINLADWFTQFAAAVGENEEEPAEPKGGGGAPEEKEKEEEEKLGAIEPQPVKMKRGRPKKNAAPPSEEVAEPPAKRGGAAASGRASAVFADKEQMLELGARFTQATSELQFLGHIKPGRKNRQEAAQRLVFPYAEE